MKKEQRINSAKPKRIRRRVRKAVAKAPEPKKMAAGGYCPDCDQPMLPAGVKKRPNEYDHASGCPREPHPFADISDL